MLSQDMTSGSSASKVVISYGLKVTCRHASHVEGVQHVGDDILIIKNRDELFHVIKEGDLLSGNEEMLIQVKIIIT